MIRGLPCLPLEDFHTRLLDEHWSARQTKEEIQQQMEEILSSFPRSRERKGE